MSSPPINGGKVALVLGIDAHNTEILAVCTSESAAQLWVIRNPDVFEQGYFSVEISIRDLVVETCGES